MSRTLLLSAFLLAIALTGCNTSTSVDPAHQQDAHRMTEQGSHRMIAPEHVAWKPGPPSLPPGAKIAILEGDPAQAGFFAFRLSFPDGYRIPPHFHPKPERITVLSGTFHLGQGDKFDDTTATALREGAYATMPEGMHHYAFAKGETVVQLSGIGPWGITYINPMDDPRKAGK